MLFHLSIACLTRSSVLRRERHSVLQHDHTPASRINPNTGIACIARLRRHQLCLCVAGILDDRHIRQTESTPGNLSVHGGLPRVDCYRFWSHGFRQNEQPPDWAHDSKHVSIRRRVQSGRRPCSICKISRIFITLQVFDLANVDPRSTPLRACRYTTATSVRFNPRSKCMQSRPHC